MTNDEIAREGGPAFPQPCCDTGHAPNTPWGMAGGGMSLRDWFAGQALAGILANSGEVGGCFMPTETKAATWAYEYADQMLIQGRKTR